MGTKTVAGISSVGPWQAAITAADLLDLPAGVLDHEGRVVHLNAAWRSLSGHEEPESARFHWTRLAHPEEDRDTAAARLRAAEASTNRIDLECRFATSTGEPHAFLASFHPLAASGANGGGWLCTLADIQAFRRREIELERSGSLLKDMLDVSVDCIKVIDLDGNLVRVNEAGSRALGVPAEPPSAMRWLSLLPEDAREAGEAALSAAMGGKPGRFPGRSIVPGEAERFWDNLLTPILDDQGRPRAIVCVSREVTAEREAVELLRESEQRLEIAARVGGLGIWDYDIAGDRLYCDESWYRIMGCDSSQPITSIDELRPLIHPDDVDRATEVERTAAELIASHRDYAVAFRIIRPDGEIRWLRSLAYVQQQDGIARRAIGFVTDITDALNGELALRDANRALEDERTSLVRKALEDPLTGIANRRHLDSELSRLCARAGESGQPLCLGMVDVDRFKQFNDRYGHPEGDAALRKVAAALQSVARKVDFVARYGGEEFTFVLPGTDDPAPFLERFDAAIAALSLAHADSPNGRLTTSCGVVVAYPPGLSPGLLLKIGDEALYEAKTAGRNRHVIRVAGR